MPTSVPAKKARNAITPTEPATSARPPEPKVTSASVLLISRGYRLIARGVQAMALT